VCLHVTSVVLEKNVYDLMKVSLMVIFNLCKFFSLLLKAVVHSLIYFASLS